MDEHYQIEIPQSFMALYSRDGRPNEARATIEARYDLCEDLAVQTADVCHTLQFKEDLSEDEVLRRCHGGLRSSDVVGGAEALWVMTRVAELLQWKTPEFTTEAG